MDDRDDETRDVDSPEMPRALIYILADMVIAAVARGPRTEDEIRESEARMASVRARFAVPALVICSQTDDRDDSKD